MRFPLNILRITLVTLLAYAPAHVAAQDATRKALFDIYRELVEINTTASVGDTTVAAKAMAKRLIDAGLPAQDVQVVVPPGKAKKGNLVARLRGSGSAGKPILLLAHLDVVEAKQEDWSPDIPPFKLTEREGFYYGRGTIDDKAMAAIFVANLIRYHKEHAPLQRDLIVALTADEEGGDDNGAAYLIEQHRPLVDAAFGLNEGGGGRSQKGKLLYNGVQASEKLYRDFELEVTSAGGHSSLPVPDNAIYTLARGLERLGKHSFPVHLNPASRGFFERSARILTGQVAKDMKSIATQARLDPAVVARLSQTALYNAMLRTTCVATQVQAGHAPNALPQRATANVNCRIVPGETPADVQVALQKVLADPKIALRLKPRAREDGPNSPSALSDEIMKPIEELTREQWPGLITIALMGTGATDSRYFRGAGIPMYGVSGIFSDIDDVRVHGKDERIGVQELYAGQEFLYRLVKRYAGVQP
jgi:acetylornithine deacetylase/succinyl-diaminopimelate desuccinylase-like protein